MFQVTSLNKKNFKSSVTECLLLVQRFGLECERHLLRTLFAYADFVATGNNTAKQTSLQLQVNYFMEAGSEERTLKPESRRQNTPSLLIGNSFLVSVDFSNAGR